MLGLNIMHNKMTIINKGVFSYIFLVNAKF